MNQLQVKGLIFDYGGTIDTSAVHWSEVLWNGYQHFQVPVSKQQFREAYVHGERTLDKSSLIQPEHNFLDLLNIKVDVETKYLVDHGYYMQAEPLRKACSNNIARYCYNHVLNVLQTVRPVLQRLAERYPMVLVTNFYGNIHAVLDDFQLPFFQEVIESAVVGIRKPDPQIFRLGVETLGLVPADVAVIGDSYSKDIVPAKALGCQTVWFKGVGWTDEQSEGESADIIIDKFQFLEQVLLF